METATNLIDKARARILFEQPYYGSILLHLPCEEMPGLGTFATDGKKIFYDSAYVVTISREEIEGILIHECWHVMLNHNVRLSQLLRRTGDKPGQGSHKRFNVAADYALNPYVISGDFMLPDCALLDSKYDGKSAEEIYGLLEQQENDQDSDSDQGSDQGDQGSDQGSDQGDQGSDQGDQEGLDLLPYPAESGDDLPTSEELEEREREIEDMIRTAAETAATFGEVPHAVRRLIDEIDQAKIDWREYLWRAAGTARESWTWNRPSMRGLPHGAYLPKFSSEGAGVVVLALDVSCSVTDHQFRDFAGEMAGILADTGPERAFVIQCDSVIQHFTEVEPGDDIAEMERHGAGGTSFYPVFDWIARQDFIPDYLVYLTDGWAPYPPEPDYPVIWALTERGAAPPYGEVIHIRSEI